MISVGELLIDAADQLKLHPGLYIPPCPIPPDGLTRIATALKFRERKELAFRAIVEGWNMDRIVRELNT